jgi:hypothetical protein
MPRNASGTYTLPSGNPVVSGTLIDATWANNTMADLGNEVTDSLSRSGEGAMLAPLRITDGVQATPSLAFSNEPSSGLYRAGTNEWWSVAAGVQVQQHTSTGAVTRFAAGAVGTPSVSAFNDVNTGIWFPAADTLAVSTAGVEALRVNSSGVLSLVNNPTLSGGTANGVLFLNGSKVATSGSALVFTGTNLGIGNNAVNARLEVTASTGEVFRADASGGAFRIVADQSDVKLQGTSSVQGWVNGSEGFRLTSSTLYTASGINVGIGTSSPGYKLTVAGASGSAVVNLLESGVRSWGIRAGGTATNTFDIADFTASATRLTIDSSGNLGLGVSPSAWSSGGNITLADNKTIGAAGQYLNLSANWYYSGGDKYVGNGYATLYYQQVGAHLWKTAPNNTSGAAAPLSWTTAMTLESGGQLLVGTTTKGAGNNNNTFFTVAGGATVYTSLIASGGQELNLLAQSGLLGVYARTNDPLLFGTNNTERARIASGGYFKASNDGTYVSSTGAYHEFRNTDAAQPILYLTATSGSYTGQTIYINNTRAASSAYKFYSANANAVEQFYVRGDGVLYAQNTTIQSLSDGRLKENVRNATEGLDVVNALRPVRYDWKAGYGNDRKDQLGFIAQEVESVFPDAVSEWSKAEGDEEPYKTVGPGALIPVLVKAIQEQQAMIKSLEAKVAALEIH